jgi:hypothetical protein
MRWLKGVDFARYDKLMVESVVFFLSDQKGYKGVDPQVMKELADAFNRELVTALARRSGLSLTQEGYRSRKIQDSPAEYSGFTVLNQWPGIKY